MNKITRDTELLNGVTHGVIERRQNSEILLCDILSIYPLILCQVENEGMTGKIQTDSSAPPAPMKFSEIDCKSKGVPLGQKNLLPNFDQKNPDLDIFGF